MVLHVPLSLVDNKFQQEDEEMNENLSFTIVNYYYSKKEEFVNA